MLKGAYQAYLDGVSEWFPMLSTQDPATNRLLHIDDAENAAAIATREHVVQLYYPNLISSNSFNVFRCFVDVCAPTFYQAVELADIPLRELQFKTEANSLAYNPLSQWILGQGHARIRIQFDLKVRRS